MGGFLDMILNFLKNILLGGALVALMNIIENPGKMLNPIIKNMNGFLLLILLFNFIFSNQEFNVYSVYRKCH